MTRLLLVSHEGVARAMCEVAATILDRPVEAGVVAVAPTDDADEVLEQIGREVTWLCADDPPLVLTDLPGATPHNLALSAVRQFCPAAPVLSGLNLPMLLRALGHLDLPADELAARVAEGGRAAVLIAGADGDGG
ncbi:MAG: PTS fructose transporter subunit IIA [Wenzhouxiangellaceae bacterium]|nr:PTS fructose transporter subunit IIA [Wenzhouxiangellaceae bacterium]